MHIAVVTAKPHVSQRDVFDQPGDAGDFHHVPGANLVLEDDEEFREQSLTRLWAPKPMASPTTPVAPRIGASEIPTSASTSMTAMALITSAIK